MLISSIWFNTAYITVQYPAIQNVMILSIGKMIVKQMYEWNL